MKCPSCDASIARPPINSARRSCPRCRAALQARVVYSLGCMIPLAVWTVCSAAMSFVAVANDTALAYVMAINGILIGGVVVGWVFFPLTHAYERTEEVQVCNECGYDMRGTVSGACPECGSAIAERPAGAK